jgi:transposase-like protein
MNTKEITKEYRLRHWAGIMRERKESGLSVKAFCEDAGFHENIYYYWQRKLREAKCEQL